MARAKKNEAIDGEVTTPAKKATKKAASKAVATATGGASKSLVNVDAALATEMANIKDAIGQASGNKIKVTSGGDFVLPDGSNLGGEIQIVVVDFISRNNFYLTPYNPDNPSPPDCYAMGKAINDMEPEPDSPAIQSDKCLTCPMNQFGSASNGKAKACKNSRLAAVLVIDPEDPDADLDPGAPLYTLDLPPTSIRNFDGFVAGVQRSLAGPPIKAVVTAVATPVGTYSVVSFEDIMPNPSYAAHFHRREETIDMLTRKPDFAAYEAKPAPRRAVAKKAAPRRR